MKIILFKEDNLIGELIQKSKSFTENKKLKNFCFFGGNKKIYSQILEFLNSKKTKLLLFGSKEIGKTILINRLSREIKDIFYVGVSDLMDVFYKYLKNKIPFKSLLDFFLSQNVVVIDSFESLDEQSKLNEFLLSLVKRSTNQKFIFVLSTEEEELKESKINFDEKVYFKSPNREEIKKIIDLLLKVNNKNIIVEDKSVDFLLNNPNLTLKNIVNKIENLSEEKKSLDSIIEEEIKDNKNDYEYSVTCVKKICGVLNIDPKEILMETRKKDVVYKRNLVMFVMKKYFSIPQKNITLFFNKNNSTISHSISQIEEKMKNDSFKKYLEGLFN